MNEKIKKIAGQASEYTKIHHNNAYWNMSEEFPEDSTWKEKFAELIIKECVEILQKETERLDKLNRSLCAQTLETAN